MDDEFELDEDGYAIVRFLDSNDETVYEGSEIPIRWDLLNASREELLDIDFTELVRLATHPMMSEFILANFGLRGLPLLPPYSLYPYQVDALTWLKDRESLDPDSVSGIRGGIVYMNMGLGKSLLSLSHCLTSPRGDYPTLVVVSKTVMYVWRQEIEKFFGDHIRVMYFHKDFMGKDINSVTRDSLCDYDIVITTYDLCLSTCRKYEYDEECFERGDEHSLYKDKIIAIHCRTYEQANRGNVSGVQILYGTPWHRVIADESQKFANPKTSTYKAVMALYGRYKWCLTGTPIRNFDTDIWAQFRFLGYTKISKATDWKRNGHRAMAEHKLTQAVYAMSYTDAGVKLPYKYEHEYVICLEGKEREVYDYVLGKTREMYDQMMMQLCDFACVLALFTRLRQAAIAPYLLTAESKREKSTEADKKALSLLRDMETKTTLGLWCHEKMTEAGIYSTKISEIINILSKIPPGAKVIIFSMFTSCLDLIADSITERIGDFGFVQVDGDTIGHERDDLLKAFRNNPDIRGLLMTYKVGSEGLNLVEATHCITVEPWWTSAVTDQAKARMWRTGQTKEVHVHNITIENTIEEKVVEICREKKEMAASYLNGTGKVSTRFHGLDKYTLGRILGVRR